MMRAGGSAGRCSAARITYNAGTGRSPRAAEPGAARHSGGLAAFLWLPDTSDSTIEGVRAAELSLMAKSVTGHKLEVPYYAYATRWTDIILTPTFMSRQGFLLGAEWVQRFDNGSMQIKASGLYQFDRASLCRHGGAAGVARGDPDVGRVQAHRRLDGWLELYRLHRRGLSDRLPPDRGKIDGQPSLCDAGDRRHVHRRAGAAVQPARRCTAADRASRARTCPSVRFEHMQDLAPGNGRVEISARLLGVRRELDSTTTVNGVPYIYGYAGNKQQPSLQAGWQTQWIGGGGFVATPYLGGRADVAYYDGASAPTRPVRPRCGARRRSQPWTCASHGRERWLDGASDRADRPGGLIAAPTQPRSALPMTMRRASCSMTPTCSATTGFRAATGRRRGFVPPLAAATRPISPMAAMSS